MAKLKLFFAFALVFCVAAQAGAQTPAIESIASSFMLRSYVYPATDNVISRDISGLIIPALFINFTFAHDPALTYSPKKKLSLAEVTAALHGKIAAQDIAQPLIYHQIIGGPAGEDRGVYTNTLIRSYIEKEVASILSSAQRISREVFVESYLTLLNVMVKSALYMIDSKDSQIVSEDMLKSDIFGISNVVKLLEYIIQYNVPWLVRITKDPHSYDSFIFARKAVRKLFNKNSPPDEHYNRLRQKLLETRNELLGTLVFLSERAPEPYLRYIIKDVEKVISAFSILRIGSDDEWKKSGGQFAIWMSNHGQQYRRANNVVGTF